MGVVLIQPPSGGQPGECGESAHVIELRAGERLTFGRGAPGVEVGVLLAHPGVSRLAGEIYAVAEYWLLTNWSRQVTYLVENLEGCGEHLRISPGRVGVPVPFEISMVSIPAALETVTFRVFAPAQPTCVSINQTDLAGRDTELAFPLDRQAKYFLVLVTLCEPRLRGANFAALPTTTQVAERLRPLPGCEQLTPRAVDFHIDYLVRRKLRLRPDGAGRNSGSGSAAGSAADGGDGFAARRMLLADFALRFGLVDEDDLALLPPTTVSVHARRGEQGVVPVQQGGGGSS